MEAVKSVWMEQWDYWAVCLTKNCNVCVGVLYSNWMNQFEYEYKRIKYVES